MTVHRNARPHVLLVLADQLRADHLGCYGNGIVRTPAIDSIAAAGTRFQRFHTASPLCMPNRATLFTGRLPSVHGVRRNGIPLSCAERTLAEALATNGYNTALIGKAHFQPYGMFAEAQQTPRKEARGFPGWPEAYRLEEIETWENTAGGRPITGPYYGFSHTELTLYHGDQVGGDYAAWLRAKDPAAARWCGPAHAWPDERYTVRDAWRTRLPEELHSCAYIAERTSAWLAAQASAPVDDQKPFFLVCSFPDPHHPFTPPGKYWDMYGVDDIPLPASFHGDNPHPALQYVRQVSAHGAKLASNHHPFAPSEREAREAIALTYGMVSNMDAAIARVLESLRENGLADTTTVVFTSDHGDLMGDHGVFLKGPMHFNGLTRVPFIWSDPSNPTPLADVHQVCSSLDVASSILEHTGCERYSGLQGESVLPLLSGQRETDRGVLVESESARLLFGRPAPFRLRTLVLSKWRVTYCTDAALCELYDLEDDALEQRNLWNEAAHRATRDALLERLLHTVVAHAETSPVPLSSG
ncbi:sulfatase-like hydrolase/transferase [Hydrogenophaga sp. 2FB]|uniref:sulfatase family protein n=1 Tax=Hydrogenophaga sp. 2FB TaxID=2502187 RepID=UPI0010F4D56F|nr:sulfatase-like hydrolase/transferase [Hydrogenophaga sp. 2FB]